MELSFKRNLGIPDRIIRGVLGVALIYLAAFEPIPLSATWAFILGVVGIFMLVEGALGY